MQSIDDSHLYLHIEEWEDGLGPVHPLWVCSHLVTYTDVVNTAQVVRSHQQLQVFYVVLNKTSFDASITSTNVRLLALCFFHTIFMILVKLKIRLILNNYLMLFYFMVCFCLYVIQRSPVMYTCTHPFSLSALSTPIHAVPI